MSACLALLMATLPPPPVAPPLPAAARYLSQRPPGEVPERFAPPQLTGFSHLGRCAFSPDGRECWFTLSSPDYVPCRLMVTRYERGAWTTPQPAPFTEGLENSAEPWFTPDGQHLVFTAAVKGSKSGTDFWRVDRTAQGWGPPVRLPEPLNSEADDFCYSQRPDGTVHFLSSRGGSAQVHIARPKGDRFEVQAVPLPTHGLSRFEGDPAVPADGRWMVFYTARPGGFGRVDLMVAFADGKGGWTVPMNLGPDFNTKAEEFGATVSTDGQYLFFTRHSREKSELWWVSTMAIDRLRK